MSDKLSDGIAHFEDGEEYYGDWWRVDLEPEGFVLFTDEETAKRYVALEQRVERLENGHERIVEWAKAYPLDVFPEPNFEKVAKVLKDNGMTLDAVSASNMRHVITEVAKIAEAALPEHLRNDRS